MNLRRTRRAIISWAGSFNEGIIERGLDANSIPTVINLVCAAVQLSHVTRKPVFWICDVVRLKPACSATRTGQCLEILNIASIDIIRPKQRTIKALIRLRGCAGWSAPLLFAYGKTGFLMMWLNYLDVDLPFPIASWTLEFFLGWFIAL